MADGNEVKIGIKVNGGKQAANEAKEVGGAIKELGGQHAAIAARGLSALGSAVGIVNAQLGNAIATVGHMAMSIRAMTKASVMFIATPIGAAIAAISVAIGGAIYAWKKWNQQIEEARKIRRVTQEINQAKEIKDLASAYDMLSQAAKRANAELERRRELGDIYVANKRRMEDIKEEIALQKELATAKNAQEREDIKNRYSKNKESREIARRGSDIETEIARAYNKSIFDKRKNEQQAAIDLAMEKYLAESKKNGMKSKGYDDKGKLEEDKTKREDLKRQAQMEQADMNSALNVARKAWEEAEAALKDIQAEEKAALMRQQELMKKRGEVNLEAEELQLRIANEEKERAERIRREQEEANRSAAEFTKSLNEYGEEQEEAQQLKSAKTSGAKYKIIVQQEQEVNKKLEEAQRRLATLNEERNSENWNTYTDEGKAEWERQIAEARREEQKLTSKSWTTSNARKDMEEAMDEENRKRMTTVDTLALGRGNRLTAMGLDGGGGSVERWNKETAANSKEMVRLLKEGNNINRNNGRGNNTSVYAE